jgi:YidC/Oxa1 family membrane protein insertase
VLIVIMCVTTFVTQKQIMRRSGPVEGQAATVQKLLLYGMPLSLFVTGFFFPIGVLLYWTINNLWTLGQQFFILRKMPPPGSDAAKAKAAADKPAIDPRTLAPKPGAKPVRTKAGRPAGASGASTTALPATGSSGSAPIDGGAGTGEGPATGSAPAPNGQRPAAKGKRKRR